jgi:hypothetical protein
MFLLAAAVLILAVLAFTFLIRQKDLPPAEVEPPTKHLEARKAQIYENLRDLQFEFRVGKLSDEDYQRTKAELQNELATVMMEIEKVAAGVRGVAAVQSPIASAVKKCPHCGAKFDKALKFCGECGKAMSA